MVARFDTYEICLYDTAKQRRLEVLHKGKSVYLGGENFWLLGSGWIRDLSNNCMVAQLNTKRLHALRREVSPGPIGQESLRQLELERVASRWLKVGADVTGNGVPNLVVTYGFNYRLAIIFELGRRFRTVSTVELGLAGGDSSFVDLDGDGFPEIMGSDQVIQGWNAHPLSSPILPVVLKLRGSRYRLHAPAMRKPPLVEPALLKLIKRAKRHVEWDSDHPSKETWGVMARLIYSGNATQARRFLKLAWPTGVKEQEFEADVNGSRKGKYSRSGFWRLLVRQLRTSQHFGDLLKLNGGRL